LEKYIVCRLIFFYKANQARLCLEYCKKIKIPEKVNTSCIEYCKNIVIFSEINESEIEEDKYSTSNSDDDSWIDMKKYL